MRELLRTMLGKLSAPWAIRAEFLYHHGMLPSLKEPRTFSEWIQARKLCDHNPRFVTFADKIAVKEHVARTVGSQYLIPTLWSGTCLPPRTARDWPIPYVLKGSHGSGQNLFIRSMQDQDWDAIESKVKQWLRNIHAKFAGEWLYAQIPYGLLVEPYYGQGENLPVDYKFFVFRGRTEYIQVDTNRATNHKRCFFDRTWVQQQFALKFPLETKAIVPPRCLDEMLQVAERLGSEFDFVRVDLYEIDGRPYFGELTFYPGSGLEVFSPKEYDTRLGELWRSAVDSEQRRSVPGPTRLDGT